jgi:hypothetical protein
MRRFQLLALFVVLTAVLGSASVATAGNGVTTTHFTAAYQNGPLGFFTCDGQRIVKSGPNGFVKDSETCAVDDPVAPNGHYTFDPGDWISDYEAFVNPGGGCERPNISGSTVVVTANGRIWTIEAYYDPSFTCL